MHSVLAQLSNSNLFYHDLIDLETIVFRNGIRTFIVTLTPGLRSPFLEAPGNYRTR